MAEREYLGGAEPTGREYLGGEEFKPTFKDMLIQNLKTATGGEGHGVVGPMVVGGAGELLKGAGAATQMFAPEFGTDMVDVGRAMTEGAKADNKVAATTGQVGSYMLPMSYLQKGANAIKAIPQVANQVKNLGAIPSFLAASGEQAAIGGLTGYGLTPDDENRKAAGLYGTAFGAASPAVGGTLNKLGEFLRGKVPNPLLQKNALEAHEAGYVMPPSQVHHSWLNRLAEGLSGKIQTAQEASFRNQDVTNRLAAKALGLGEDTMLTPEVLKSVRDNAGKAYTDLRMSGRINPDQSFRTQLDDIVKDFRMAEKDFPNSKLRPEVDLIESLKSKSFDANSAVSKIVELRRDADKAFRSGDTSMSSTYKQAAGALEDAIEKHLQKTNQTAMLDKFRNSRQLMAKSYDVEDALNAATGTIDAKKLAGKLSDGKLTGELKQIASFASAFPKAAQRLEGMGSVNGVSPLDMMFGTGVGIADYFLGGEKGGGGLAGLASVALRPSARGALLSKPMQANLVNNSPILSDNVRNLIQRLSLEGAIKQGASKQKEE